MSDAGPEESQSDTVKIPRWAAVLTSVLAAGLAAVHLAIPSLRIDVSTLVLLAVAALPWAGPLVRTTRLGPFELNQLRVQSERLHRAVADVTAQVEEVRRLVITGATPEQQARIETEVTRYRGYLGRIGIAGDLVEPAVRVVHDPAEMSPGFVSEYRDGAVLILADYADRPTVALREYTHYALRAAERLPPVQDAPVVLIESGLAFYFPCSFADDGHFGSLSASNSANSDSPWIHDITMPGSPAGRGASAFERYAAGGHAWAHRFWKLRGMIGPALADTAFASAWFDDDMMNADDAKGTFAAAVGRRLPDAQAELAAKVLTSSDRPAARRQPRGA